ncbi:MAG: acyl-CoA dehydrogenase family protein [Actinobacteria bacterium]|nr:acyl-CoA dehydrogenase family protein [Actinomycetota bacterium]
MDFDESPEDAAFRGEALAWLAENASRRGPVTANAVADDPAHVARCKKWQATLADAGWAAIAWPAAYGGRGATSRHQSLFNEEQSKFDVSTGVFAVGLGMAGPTLIAHGTEEQKDRFLPPLLRGDEVWCQLFSEPGAGSDLAGLSTRAELDGNDFVVNGQKVWTSGAQHSDWAILLARTDFDQAKHKGLTYFVLDMRSPGIEVRPLRQINGVAHFNEVFLTDVRVPAANVLGEVNGGWGVALTTLANERNFIGGGTSSIGFANIVDRARASGRTNDPLVRQELAEAFTRFEVLRFIGYRIQTAFAQGRVPGAEASILKLLYSRHVERNGNLGVDVEGAAGMLSGADAPDDGLWQQQFLTQWAMRIGGGTDEVQRNVVGERVLGLPAEPRPDKYAPFRELVRN